MSIAMPEALKQAARDEAEKRGENDEEFCIVCFKAGIGWLWDMLPELVDASIPDPKSEPGEAK